MPQRTLILGDRGTGKTQFLITRFLALTAQGADPSRILLLAGSRREQQYMLLRRFQTQINQPMGPIPVRLFRSLVREFIHNFYWLKTPQAPLMIGTAEYLSLMKQFLAAHPHFFKGAQLDRQLYQHLMSRQRRRAENYFDWATLAERTARLEEASIAAQSNEFLQAYNEWLLSHSPVILDYSLQVDWFYELLSHPEVQPWLQQFSHVLVDDLEETRPIEQHFYEQLWPYSELLYTANPFGGVERHMGANPDYLKTLQMQPTLNIKQLTSDNPQITLADKVYRVFCGLSCPPATSQLTRPVHLSQEPTQMLEALVHQVKMLLLQGAEPQQITLITWHLADPLCLQLESMLQRIGQPPDVFRGSEVIQRNPLINTLLSLMRLVLWQELQHMNEVPRLTGFEMSQIYSFCTDLNAFTLAQLRATCGDRLNEWGAFLNRQADRDPRLKRLQQTVQSLRDNYPSPECPTLLHLAQQLWENLLSPSAQFLENYQPHAAKAFFRTLKHYSELHKHWPQYQLELIFIRDMLAEELAENPDLRRDLEKPHIKVLTLQRLCELHLESDYQLWFDLKSPHWQRTDHHPIDNRLLLSRAWPLNQPWTFEGDEQMMDDKLAHTFRKGLQYCRKQAWFYACQYNYVAHKQRFERLVQAISQPAFFEEPLEEGADSATPS